MLHSFLRWIISNSPAMNVLFIAILGAGFYCGMNLRRESFPDFDTDMIFVTVPYPGATPEEVENGICEKIEEALQTVEGIRKITSTASEGMGMVMLELDRDMKHIDRTLNEVKSAVDRIPSFPELAENRIVQHVKLQETILSVGVLGPPVGTSPDNTKRGISAEERKVEAALALRQVAEDVRTELLLNPKISMVNLVGTKAYQIDIEVPEHKLREYNLTLDQVASIIRTKNLQMPGGTLRAPSQEINVRTDNRRHYGDEIGRLPLITARDGTVIRVEDIANVRDEFVDGDISATVYLPPETGIPEDIDSIVGQNVVALNVLRTRSEDMLAMVAEVRAFVDEKNKSGTLPPGYTLITWGGFSEEVESRLNMLLSNGLQGLLIVFIVLALFLEIRLAFWVSLGIPFSICAAMLFHSLQGLTMDMMTMFAFILGIGIVVDDAIIAGENVYRHREMGKDYLTAAVDGIAEVCPAVISSVATTMIAFTPLLFVVGMFGQIFYLIPLVLIMMLTASLFESFTVLPCHLAHRDNLFLKMLAGYLYIFAWILIPLKIFRHYADFSLDKIIYKVYTPALQVVLKNRLIFVVASCCALTLSVVVVYSGKMPFVIMPNMDGNQVQVNVSFPSGTPAEVTERWTQHLERAFWKVAKEYEDAGKPIGVRSFRVVGTVIQGSDFGASGMSLDGGDSSTGAVSVDLVFSEERGVSSMEIVERWREAAGVIPGAESVTFDSQMSGPGGGAAIEFMLSALPSNVDQLEAAVEEAKAYLAEIYGTRDVQDSDVPGKYEFRLKIKENALAMGVSEYDLASVIRATYYGAEVQRLQRGRHEVKVMVCYPREDRRSLADFNEIRVRTPNGEFPITELADIEVVRGYSSITRRNQMRSITVMADVDESVANTQQINGWLVSELFPRLKEKYPGVYQTWEGQQEEFAVMLESLMFLAVLAVCAMYVLLTVQFRSYLQPFMIMAIMPFGWIGVVLGHWLFNMPIMMTTAFGFVALCGVIVNGSIVLIDFIDRYIRSGHTQAEALLTAGQDRFRPVFLTSATTFGGLLPMVLETSLQAQIIIPMAVSLAGGVAFSLLFVLFFVPVLYSYYTDLLSLFGLLEPPPEDRDEVKLHG